jgi:hypothetical protein
MSFTAFPRRGATWRGWRGFCFSSLAGDPLLVRPDKQPPRREFNKSCPASRLPPGAGNWCRWPSSFALSSHRSHCWASLLSASLMGQCLTSTSVFGCCSWQERALVFGWATHFGGAEGSVWQMLLLPSLPFRACLRPCSYWLFWSPSPDGTDRRPSRIGVCRSFPRASVLSSAASSALRCGSRLSRMVPVKSGADARRFLHGPA